MNNEIKSQQRGTVPQEEEKAKKHVLLLFWKLYHNWVVSCKTQNHWNLKEAQSLGKHDAKKVLGPTRRVRFTQSTQRQASIRENEGPSLGKIKVSKYSPANSLHYEIWGQITGIDSRTTAMRPRWGMESCQSTFASSKTRTKLHSTHPRKNGYSPLRQQKSRRKDNLRWIPELICISSARKALTLPNWRLWGCRGIQRRWWRPTARCKQGKKPRYMSKNLKKHPQFFRSGSSARIMGRFTTGPAVKSHISRKIGKTISWKISNYVPFVVLGLFTSSSTSSPTASTSSSKDSVTGTENPAIEVGVWVQSYGETRLQEPAEIENANENEDDEELRSELLLVCSFRVRVKPVAWTSRHFQFFSRKSKGVSSKSGTGLG